MTAVAPPVQFQQPSRTGWPSGSLNGLSHEGLKTALTMQNQQPRKTAQRSNSSASLSSSSSSSTIQPSSAQTNGNSVPDGAYTTRKQPPKGRQIFVPIGPIGKSEPTAGLSTARPQPVSSASSGPSAASAVSALHAPMLPSQQMANQSAQQNGTMRNGNPGPEATAILHLFPMNGTFERKTITVPFYPDVLRIGRQTNAKTAPTPSNGFFDSKVLSRQHAEIYAERNSGRVFIRDVKSSNGTFVNGQRLSPENKESEPHPLQEHDVLELGIDIVSEDQKTVVHHKVAARVEHAGIYTPGAEMSLGDLDSGYPQPHANKRSNSANAKANALAVVMQARDASGASNYQQARTMFTPITTETIVKKLNRELNLAKQQSQDIARSKQCLDALIAGEPKRPDKDNKADKTKAAPTKSLTDLKSHFSEPPAPPPQQPLPEKPDVAKALADPVIQPLLMRADATRIASPTRPDHSQALLILTQELKLAKDQIPSLEDRVRNLESELQLERTARETAEELAHKLKDVSEPDGIDVSSSESRDVPGSSPAEEPTSLDTDGELPDLQTQLERLRASMDEMKQHMEAYRRRAETAESERDEARQTLAEMIEQKRKENVKAERRRSRSRSSQGSTRAEEVVPTSNGHALEPIANSDLSVAALLEQAGVKGDVMLTSEQATALRQLLAQHTAHDISTRGDHPDTDSILPVNRSANLSANGGQYGWYYAPAIAVMVLGYFAMVGLDKIETVHRLIPWPLSYLCAWWEILGSYINLHRENLYRIAYRQGRNWYHDYAPGE